MTTPLQIAREWVGSQPDDTALQAAIDEWRSPHRAALAILRARRADMIAQPAKWAVVDDYSQDASANLRALDDQIARLEALVPEEGTDPVGWSSTPIIPPSLDR